MLACVNIHIYIYILYLFHFLLTSINANNFGPQRACKRMATESDGEEEGKLTGNEILVVDDDLREMAKNAAWSVSSCKPGNGVQSLRDENLDTYWQ